MDLCLPVIGAVIRRRHYRTTYCPALDDTTVSGIRSLGGMYGKYMPPSWGIPIWPTGGFHQFLSLDRKATALPNDVFSGALREPRAPFVSASEVSQPWFLFFVRFKYCVGTLQLV